MPRAPVAEREKTCIACPAQWEGRMDSGETFYVRYRYGLLTVGFGPDLDAAVEAASAEGGFEVELSEDGLDGWLEWEEAEPHFEKAWAEYTARRDRKPS